MDSKINIAARIKIILMWKSISSNKKMPQEALEFSATNFTNVGLSCKEG